MEIKTEVIDNFLDKHQFDCLKKKIVFSDLPYELTKKVAGYEGGIINETPHWYWYGIHVLYKENEPASEAFEIVKPLIEKIVQLGYGFGFIRAKVNFYPYTETVYEHGPHIDYDFPNYGAVFSLNTCDGFTRMPDGSKVESVENRIVFFDSSKQHNSSTTSNASGRFNINLNFR